MITTITPPVQINTTITYDGGIVNSTSISQPIAIATIINVGRDAEAIVQVNSNWNAITGVAQILNKPSTFPPDTHTHSQYALSSSLSDVATSGNYSDLVGLPTLGSASALNVSGGAVAASGEVVKGDDTRLSDARTPTTHSHSIAQVTGLQTALDGKQPLSTPLTNTTAAFTTALESKLSGVQSGATSNSTDVQLRDRSTHTGTQLSSTISDFNSSVDVRVASGITGKENSISSGTASQYWRGDKSWQTLDKASVGLSNLDNTSDVNKPISSATQTALNSKQPLATVLTNTTASFTTALETKLNAITLSTGVVEADFGAVGTLGTSETSVAITGQTGITSSRNIAARIELSSTATHTAEDHRYAATFLGVSVGNIVDGVGFTIYIRTLYPMTGTFSIRWAWQ